MTWQPRILEAFLRQNRGEALVTKDRRLTYPAR